MPEKIKIKCPICEMGEIVTLYTPKTFITKYARASSNKKSVSYYKEEKYVIISPKCPNCGKSKKDIEKALKEGKQPSREEIIKRMKETGLPTKF